MKKLALAASTLTAFALLVLIAPLALNSSTAAPAPATRPTSQPANLTIRCTKEGDSITARQEGGKTILDIKSPRGIGGATLTLKAQKWPDELILRVHLRGLEHFQITSCAQSLHASVLSHSGNKTLLSLWSDGKEGPPLDKTSPCWMEIQKMDAQGKPAEGLPKEGGLFEMRVPGVLLTDQNKTVELGWIDFYR